MHSTRILLSLAAIAGSQVSAQSNATAADIPNNATATALTIQSALFNASGFNTPIGNSLAFNIPLSVAGSILNVQYGDIFIENGQAYPASAVAEKPTLYLTPRSAMTTNATWTIMLADAAALGDPDAEGFYRHYLANGVSLPANQTKTQTNLTFTPTDGTVITDYAAPGPIVGTGPHRYAWLVFQQKWEFVAPADLSTAGTAPGHWNVTDYVQQSHLRDLVAARWFTVENGAPTASILSSTVINTATVSVASSTSSSAAANQTTAGVVANAAGGKTSNTSSAASQFVLNAGLGLGGLVAFAMTLF